MDHVWKLSIVGVLLCLVPGRCSQDVTTDTSLLFNETFNGICESCYCEAGYPYLIDCSGRDFETVPSELDWFKEKNDIEVVMDRNNMFYVSSIDGPKEITKLSFRHNKIKMIAMSAFMELPKLTSLDLAYNFLPTSALTKDVFQGPSGESGYMQLNLTCLDLSYNMIHSLDKDTFDHVEGIRELYLDGNPLQVIDQQTGVALTTLRNLRVLSLAKTGLSDLPLELFDAFLNLHTINLASNSLLTVPAALRHTRKLLSLTLNNNPIVTFDDTSFVGLDDLKELSISEMSKLLRIESFSFGNLKQLKTLHCAYNKKLEYISSKAFVTSDGFSVYLSEIHLNDNNLNTLTSELLPYNSLRIFNAQENPFVCDCRLAWIFDGFLKNLNDNSPQYTLNLDCKHPKSLAGTSFYGISRSDLAPCTGNKDFLSYTMDTEGSQHYTAVSVTVASVIFVLVIVVFGLLYFYKKVRYSPTNPLTQQIRYVKAETDEKVDV